MHELFLLLFGVVSKFSDTSPIWLVTSSYYDLDAWAVSGKVLEETHIFVPRGMRKAPNAASGGSAAARAAAPEGLRRWLRLGRGPQAGRGGKNSVLQISILRV